MSPHRLGLAHPALARLTALRHLHTCWALPREAPPNLAPLTALTYLGAAGASSLPYVVPQVAETRVKAVHVLLCITPANCVRTTSVRLLWLPQRAALSATYLQGDGFIMTVH